PEGAVRLQGQRMRAPGRNCRPMAVEIARNIGNYLPGSQTVYRGAVPQLAVSVVAPRPEGAIPLQRQTVHIAGSHSRPVLPGANMYRGRAAAGRAAPQLAARVVSPCPQGAIRPQGQGMVPAACLLDPVDSGANHGRDRPFSEGTVPQLSAGIIPPGPQGSVRAARQCELPPQFGVDPADGIRIDLQRGEIAGCCAIAELTGRIGTPGVYFAVCPCCKGMMSSRCHDDDIGNIQRTGYPDRTVMACNCVVPQLSVAVVPPDRKS